MIFNTIEKYDKKKIMIDRSRYANSPSFHLHSTSLNDQMKIETFDVSSHIISIRRIPIFCETPEDFSHKNRDQSRIRKSQTAPEGPAIFISLKQSLLKGTKDPELPPYKPTTALE